MALIRLIKYDVTSMINYPVRNDKQCWVMRKTCSGFRNVPALFCRMTDDRISTQITKLHVNF